MNEAEPAMPGPGTNDRWRLDGRVALVTGASAGLGDTVRPAYWVPSAHTSWPARFGSIATANHLTTVSYLSIIKHLIRRTPVVRLFAFSWLAQRRARNDP